MFTYDECLGLMSALDSKIRDLDKLAHKARERGYLNYGKATFALTNEYRVLLRKLSAYASATYALEDISGGGLDATL